jgi:hypothetical protein
VKFTRTWPFKKKLKFELELKTNINLIYGNRQNTHTEKQAAAKEASAKRAICETKMQL